MAEHNINPGVQQAMKRNFETAQYISDQLYNFLISKKCCQAVSVSFRSAERAVFAEYAAELGLFTRNFVTSHGVETIMIHKNNCSHYVQAELIEIQERSSNELFELINSCRNSHVSSDLSLYTTKLKPSVTLCRFAFKDSVPKVTDTLILKGRLKALQATQTYQEYFLSMINCTKVVVVNGNSRYHKSLVLPVYILENCIRNRQHCKILCVELNTLLAVHNCEFLAKNFDEKVGEKIAYQVQGQSFIKETSHIIFTSVAYLLRVLMGQENSSFGIHNVSHLIINDIQLRNPYCDLLISEIRNALQYLPDLRLVLLSNSKDNSVFLDYFNESQEIRFENEAAAQTDANSLIFYMDEIRQIVKHKYAAWPPSGNNTKQHRLSPPSCLQNIECNRKLMDYRLDLYEQTATDESFNAVLYMICGEFASLNQRHTITGSTILTIAATLGKANHIRTLLHMQPDPYIQDAQNQNAIDRALLTGNPECVELLRQYCCTINLSVSKNSDPTDMSESCCLINDLISVITMCPTDWPAGNIIVFVPCFEQLVHVNFNLLRLKLGGELPKNVIIRVLHKEIEKEEIDKLFESPANSLTIIISTDIGEIFPFPISFKYVIDCARSNCAVYDLSSSTSFCTQMRLKWNSKECLDNRLSIIAQAGACFRLMPNGLYNQLYRVRTPDLLTMPLDRICLAVKLLSPNKLIAEYLKSTIAPPPYIHAFQTVEYLKKINILDDMEDVTWLGCRLIDLPVECRLGKLLIFGIMLQCFDPILTIVSFLTLDNTLRLGGLSTAAVVADKQQDMEHFSSDHLIFLRLYREWQNSISVVGGGGGGGGVNALFVDDERDFARNCIIEQIAHTRSKIVVAMRSAQLIHNQGPLNMHALNSFSMSWPMIKAALVVGTYPNVCMFDPVVQRFKSVGVKELVIHASSILRQISVQKLPKSPSWLVYSNEVGVNVLTSYNSIKNCTVINPLAILLLAGQISTNNEIFFIESSKGLKPHTNVYVDDWICFTIDATVAQLVLKARQLFHNHCNNYLQHCTLMEKHQNSNMLLAQTPRLLLRTFVKIFSREDAFYGFRMPENVGDRPKAYAVKFLQTCNEVFGSCSP